MPHMCGYLKIPEEDIRFPEATVISSSVGNMTKVLRTYEVIWNRSKGS